MICGDEVINGKPNPEIFLKAASILGVKPEESLVLEDSENGILAAHAAGIPCICVPDMKVPEVQFRKKIIKILESLQDVEEYLEAING